MEVDAFKDGCHLVALGVAKEELDVKVPEEVGAVGDFLQSDFQARSDERHPEWVVSVVGEDDGDEDCVVVVAFVVVVRSWVAYCRGCLTGDRWVGGVREKEEEPPGGEVIVQGHDWRSR